MHYNICGIISFGNDFKRSDAITDTKDCNAAFIFKLDEIDSDVKSKMAQFGWILLFLINQVFQSKQNRYLKRQALEGSDCDTSLYA